MRRIYHVVFLVLFLLSLLPLPAEAFIRSPATTFATLPAGAAHPEGMTVDAAGNVYVTLFAVGATPPGQLIVFDSSGRLLRQVTVVNSSNLLLGLAFHPNTGQLLIIDFGHKNVLAVDPVSGASTVFMTIPLPPTARVGLNDLTFDSAGNVYLSDSFQGTIWRTGPTGGVATAFVTDPLLTTKGVPGFGANGLRFNQNETILFVANTGDDTIVKVPVHVGASGSLEPVNPAKPAQVFVNSVNGPDGLLIDDQDNLWICANQADELVVLDPTGRVIAKLGDFGGIDPSGAPVGLLFPASPVFSGHFVLVTNLALDLRLFGTPTVDSQWAAQVTTHTVSKIRMRIPPIPGLP